MQAAATLNQRNRVPAALLTAALTIIAFGAHIGVREFSSLEPGAPLRLALTAALVVAFAAHVYTTVRAMRSFDEWRFRSPWSRSSRLASSGGRGCSARWIRATS